MRSVSKCSLRSLSRTRGTISLSAKFRAVSRISRCSSVSSKSITWPILADRGIDHSSNRNLHPAASRFTLGTPLQPREDSHDSTWTLSAYAIDDGCAARAVLRSRWRRVRRIEARGKQRRHEAAQEERSDQREDRRQRRDGREGQERLADRR